MNFRQNPQTALRRYCKKAQSYPEYCCKYLKFRISNFRLKTISDFLQLGPQDVVVATSLYARELGFGEGAAAALVFDDRVVVLAQGAAEMVGAVGFGHEIERIVLFGVGRGH